MVHASIRFTTLVWQESPDQQMTGDTPNPTVSLHARGPDSSRFGFIGKLRPANYGVSIRHAENRQRENGRIKQRDE